MTKYLRITKIPNQFIVQSANLFLFIAAVDHRRQRTTDVRFGYHLTCSRGRNVYLFNSPELDQTVGATE